MLLGKLGVSKAWAPDSIAKDNALLVKLSSEDSHTQNLPLISSGLFLKVWPDRVVGSRFTGFAVIWMDIRLLPLRGIMASDSHRLMIEPCSISMRT